MFSSEICEIFKNTYFEENMPTAASEVNRLFWILDKFKQILEINPNFLCLFIFPIKLKHIKKFYHIYLCDKAEVQKPYVVWKSKKVSLKNEYI